MCTCSFPFLLIFFTRLLKLKIQYNYGKIFQIAESHLNTDILNKIILFFNTLIETSNKRKHKLLIGLSINSYNHSIYSGNII